jgi:DNA-binding response OmpR family regulator
MPKTGRVLIVEDEPAVGQVAAAVLIDEGHEVRWVANGRDGLAVLIEWRPDVIVLDLMMPVMDGRTFRAEQRRLTGPAARAPVIVLSGAREARAVADEMGAVAAITKPFDLDELVTTVGRVLDRQAS